MGITVNAISPGATDSGQGNIVVDGGGVLQ
jgi:hypothetical protein